MRDHGVCVPHDSLSTSWTLTVTTVPDRRQAYRLGIRPSGIVDQTLGVKVSDTGVLTSLNYAGTDQRASIVTTIAKGVAGVLGAVTRGGLAASRATRTCATRHRRRSPCPLRRSTSFAPSISPSFRRRPIPRRRGRRSRGRTPRSRAISSCSRSRISSCRVSPLPEPTSTLEPRAAAKGTAIGCTGADSVCAKIYFREPIMRVIRVHAADAIDRAQHDVLGRGGAHRAARARRRIQFCNISFGTQVLGAGKMALTFGAHGNVTGIEQSSSAALNAAAGAATSGYESAHAAYDAALKARVDELDLEIKAAKDNATLRSIAGYLNEPSMTRTRHHAHASRDASLALRRPRATHVRRAMRRRRRPRRKAHGAARRARDRAAHGEAHRQRGDRDRWREDHIGDRGRRDPRGRHGRSTSAT